MPGTYFKPCGKNLGEDCRKEPSAEEYKALIVKLLAKMDDPRLLRILYQRTNTLLLTGDWEPIDPAAVRDYLNRGEEEAP